MKIPSINLHIHSTYSDGKSPIEKIIKRAILEGLEYIAITDHFSNSLKANIIPTLNTISKIDKYKSEISTCKSYLIRRNEKLQVFTGVEIDLGSSKEYILKYIKPEDYDIILFEYLESLESIAFIKSLLTSWKKFKSSNKPFPLLGLAHFDPSYFLYQRLQVLINFLLENEIFIEFNSSYSQYYSRKYSLFYDKVKEAGIMVSIGCDSHDTKNLADINGSWEAIKDYSLQDNLFQLIRKIERQKE
ncbi:MAG: PHP domain-containing protein [Promethearchaeota archaeon]